ncbi:two-component system sensor histidine kinase NtrB [Oceanidesulfovibrio marinus]|uniref:histidine kinase n=1 Tax=Oceanidesulfovibrio marinus TaxID=370038 RepID=A0A6P1ZMQ7_9BACT|nr:ATP-binding protein [Oceanidesulfovibrio marinus]QJT10180.1 PAS domain S-box protein [Oceanidesulfovibrio marinus]TVM35705.1 PAS domain-containing sensor histidine kinase [Oceanidesulfovibrio marinus]
MPEHTRQNPPDTDTDAKAFLIGAVGPHTALDEFVELVNTAEFRSSCPWMAIGGVVVMNGGDPAADPPAQVAAHAAANPVFSSVPDLLAAVPDLELLLDLSGDSEHFLALRASLPPTVSAINARSAGCFSRLLHSMHEFGKCVGDLSYTRSIFNTLFDEVQEDIVLLAPDGTILDMNNHLPQRVHQPKERLIGGQCSDIEGGSFCCTLDAQCPLSKTMETRQKAESVYTYVDKDGRMRYYRIYTYPVFNAEGEIRAVVEMRRDITNRTHMEQRLAQSEKMAAIGELSTYIAHEIRNPLFAIAGFANALMRSSALGENDREKVSIILEESKRLDSILKSTTNFARPTDAKQDWVDVNAMVRETMELFGLACDSQKISCCMELDDSIARAKGDADLLKQCVINLIRNAMEAMQGGGKLQLRTGMRDQFISLEAEDNGPGIAEDLREKVFNPFFSTKNQGAGLGLAMTKKIIEEMGGQVELTSRVGQGTTVRLLLPPVLAVDEDADAELGQESANGSE